MTPKRKAPTLLKGLFRIPLRTDGVCGKVTTSKQLQPAMTFQVYTKPIKSRNLLPCDMEA